MSMTNVTDAAADCDAKFVQSRGFRAIGHRNVALRVGVLHSETMS